MYVSSERLVASSILSLSSIYRFLNTVFLITDSSILTNCTLNLNHLNRSPAYLKKKTQTYSPYFITFNSAVAYSSILSKGHIFEWIIIIIVVWLISNTVQCWNQMKILESVIAFLFLKISLICHCLQDDPINTWSEKFLNDKI